MFRKLMLGTAVLAAVVAVDGRPALALVVGLIDYATGNTVLVTNDDNKPPDDPNNPFEDQDPRVGVLSIKPQTFAGYTLSGITVTSKPFLPSGPPRLLLSVGSVLSTAQPTSSIGILFGDFDYSWPASTPLNPTSSNAFQLTAAGITQGSVTASAWIDPDNSFQFTPGPTSQPVSALSITSRPPGFFSAFSQIRPSLPNGAPFRMFGSVTIQHAQAGQLTSLTAQAAVVPVPSALPLLAGALGALAALLGVRRRRTGPVPVIR